MSTPNVSVIIPVYNSEKYIEETLKSVFAQSYKDFEVIVVDDGSTDNTAKVLSGYKDKLIYIRKENEGISIARNTGIAHALGKYVAFIDHDDIWYPEKLGEQITLLEYNRNAHLCFSDAYLIDEKGKRNGRLFNICPPFKGMVFKQLLMGNFIPILTAVVRKEILKETGLFDPEYKMVEDWDFFIRVAKQYPVIFIDSPLAGYRVHTGSFSAKRDIMLKELISVIDNYAGLVDRNTMNRLKAKNRNFQFELGIAYLCKETGHHEGREYFLKRIKEARFYFSFYLGLALSYLPGCCANFIRRFFYSKNLHQSGIS